jgi:hypothetical protein
VAYAALRLLVCGLKAPATILMYAAVMTLMYAGLRHLQPDVCGLKAPVCGLKAPANVCGLKLLERAEYEALSC